MAGQSKRGPSPHGQVTLADVGRHVGVSAQSVSNALHNPTRLSVTTREKILAGIRELGYQPNRSARALRSRRSHLIGVKAERTGPDRAWPIHDAFLHALAAAAAETGSHLILCQASTPEEELAGYRELLRTMTIDAVVLAGTTQKDVRIHALTELGVPFATFGRPWDGRNGHPWVDVDGRAGLRAATELLLGLGHTSVAYLGWPNGSEVGGDRRQGWLDACASRRLAPGVEIAAPESFRAAFDVANDLLASASAPTAIACASDTLALAVLRAAHARGVCVGPELAVTGFDDSPAAAFTTPALTSLRQPLTAVARQLIAAVQVALVDRGAPASQILLAPELIVRASTSASPHGKESL